MNISEVRLYANDIRTQTVKAIAAKGGGHIGGCLSIADLLAVLYGEVMRYRCDKPDWEDRDYFICSKGHAGPAVYSSLALKNFFPMEWLLQLNRGGTKLPGHCDRLKVPGIDATSGSLGQGLSIACGVAQGLLKRNNGQYVYCVLGDGESDEGQVWEAAAYAANYNISNLIAFTDWNKKQIDGTNDKVMKLGDISEKYRSFGWNSQIINGSDIEEIYNAIIKAKSKDDNKPTMYVLDTVKGAGVNAIEQLENNHCIGLNSELAQRCINELEEQKRIILGGNI